MIRGEALLAEVRADTSLIHRLGLGLSDVTDEREVRFQTLASVTEEEFSGRPSGRPFHHVYLRKESNLGKPERYGKHAWYQIRNGWAAGYLTDREALNAYITSGEQLTLEVA